MWLIVGQSWQSWGPKTMNVNPQKASRSRGWGARGSFWGGLGNSCSGLGALLSPRWPQERKRRPKLKVLSPYWGSFWSPKSIKIDPKSDLKCDQFFDRFGDRVLEQFGANLAPFWPPKPPQNGAKLAPKSIQVGVLIWEVFFDVCWAVFYWFVDSTWHGRSG